MVQSASPPTRRVVEVMELLASAGKPLTASEVATALSLARATVTAVLTELAAAGWVRRDGERRFRPGPALAALSPAESELPEAAVRAELRTLAVAAGCGVTLSRIERATLTVVAKEYAPDARVVPGLTVGQSIPLAYPAGAAVMPWRAEAERAAWSKTAPGEAAALLEFVRANGCALFRPDSDDAGVVDVLADLLGALGAELLQPDLRARVLRQLARLTARPYRDTEFTGDDPLPVSYLSAPVFAGGAAPYELQLGPLRPAVGRAERMVYVEAITAGAQAMSVALGR